VITAGIGTQQLIGTHRPTAVRTYTLVDGTRVLAFDALLESGASLSIPVAFDPADLLLLWVESNARATIARGAPATNEVITLSVTGGTPTGGTVNLKWAAGNSGSIAYNATAADVQAGLEAASWIAPGDVACTGGPWPGTPVVATFQGALAGVDVADDTPPHIYTMLWTTGTVDIVETVKGAAGTSADVTPVEPGWPTVWIAGRPDPCPFTAPVTGLSLANLATGRQTLVRFRALLED
jgi:hypothetical protein